MDHLATRIILKEHASISATLHSMLLLLSQHRRQRTAPDFAALRAMLFYADEFPRWQHHRKESEHLFPKLRARTPVSRELLDRLEQDHQSGERRIRQVEHACWPSRSWGSRVARPSRKPRAPTSISMPATWRWKKSTSSPWPSRC